MSESSFAGNATRLLKYIRVYLSNYSEKVMWIYDIVGRLASWGFGSHCHPLFPLLELQNITNTIGHLLTLYLPVIKHLDQEVKLY